MVLPPMVFRETEGSCADKLSADIAKIVEKINFFISGIFFAKIQFYFQKLKIIYKGLLLSVEMTIHTK